MEQFDLNTEEIATKESQDALTQKELDEIFGLNKDSDIVAYNDYGWVS